MTLEIKRPRYESVDLKIGLRWQSAADWQYTEKMDGVRHELKIGTSIIIGEQMHDGRFYAFDIATHQGQDIRKASRRARLAILDGFNLLRPESSPDGARLLETVLARGGEGIVAAHWDAPFVAALYRCKRVETHDCIIAEKHPLKMSVHLFESGIDRGWCPALGYVFDKVNVGDVVEVKCFSITTKEKFREPRLVRVRSDKKEVA